MKSMYARTIASLEKAYVAYMHINDTRGRFIVAYRDGHCPDGKLNEFYEWGARFGPLGEVIDLWGSMPVGVLDSEKAGRR